MVDCVCGDGEDRALREVVVAECDAGAWRDDAGEAEGGGGVDAEGFRYHVVETVKAVNWPLIERLIGLRGHTRANL